MEETKVSLKLLVDTKANKVLFAEAGKDFVDFLFHILSLPVGTVMKLLNEDGTVGSRGALYKSIESQIFDDSQSNLEKENVQKPINTVKEVETYMVLDNLEVSMSTISGITLMNKFNVKDVSTLTEKHVQVGLAEGLAMLKASFEVPNTVLTTVFLGRKLSTGPSMTTKLWHLVAVSKVRFFIYFILLGCLASILEGKEVKK